MTGQHALLLEEGSTNNGSAISVVTESYAQVKKRLFYKYVEQLKDFKAQWRGIGPDKYEFNEWLNKEISFTCKEMFNEYKSTIISQGGHFPSVTAEDAMRLAKIERGQATLETAIDAFCPVKFWRVLELSFNFEEATKKRLTELADTINDRFRLCDHYMNKQTPVTKAGTVRMNTTVYIDSLDKKWSGKNTLHYNSKERICSLLYALSEFCAHVDDEETSSNLKSLINDVFLVHSFEIESRRRIKLSSITVVTYHNRFEFQFSMELANKLRVFLSKYATKGER